MNSVCVRYLTSNRFQSTYNTNSERSRVNAWTCSSSEK